MSKVTDQILALRTLFQGDDLYLAPTRDQLALNGKVAEVVGEDYRHAVLQLVTGVSMLTSSQPSAKTLTRHTFSTMIDWWLEADGDGLLLHPWRMTREAREFLLECKAIVESHAGENPWEIDISRL